MDGLYLYRVSKCCTFEMIRGSRREGKGRGSPSIAPINEGGGEGVRVRAPIPFKVYEVQITTYYEDSIFFSVFKCNPSPSLLLTLFNI